jgi:fucose permease
LLQILIFASLTAILPFVVSRFIPADTGKHEHEDAAKPRARESFFKDRRLLWLAFGILGMTLGEGASNDWLVLAFVQDYEVSRTQAGVAFTILTIAMTIARFFGSNVVDRFGRHKALRAFALIGVVGVLLVILGNNLWLGYLGSALWGVGVALGFPLFISAAGDGDNSARKVSFVTSFGYAAFLVGPPMLGLIGQSVGLLNMFYLLAVLIAASAYFASATRSDKV